MESFKINNLLKCYVRIFFKVDSLWKLNRLTKNLIVPLVIAIIILYSIESLKEIKEAISLVLSILIGLLFNFVSSFSSRLNSEHLKQNASQKIKRLDLIKNTSDGAFVTIVLSLLGLTILLLLTFISNSDYFNHFNLKKWINIVFGSICLIVLYHIFLMIIYMINRLRKLVNVDTDQEKEYLKSVMKKELDEWDSLD